MSASLGFVNQLDLDDQDVGRTYDSKRVRIYSVVRIVIDKLELINPSCTDSVIDTRQG